MKKTKINKKSLSEIMLKDNKYNFVLYLYCSYKNIYKIYCEEGNTLFLVKKTLFFYIMKK